MHSDAATLYLEACNREHAECALELVQAFDNNEREVSLSQRAVPLNDVDISCIAEALGNSSHSIRVLNMEGNAFGLPGLQTLLEAIEENPGIIRELRLGKNKLKDQAAVVIGHMIARDGCGLKVLDLSENAITKLGVIPIAAALSNESCDIVELSFHNNKIEADAAAYLSQAIVQAGKLRHLHLGYNAIRDTGAAQLAQCIPITLSLSTLDLTANRIGPSGGKEIARALMTSTCNIQRLNLRHNLFDSETIEMFSAVITTNTSLIQLFLGFMNPAPEASVSVLGALCRNRTLLLLDIYGWKLPADDSWSLIDNIQRANSTLAAIVTDACQSIAHRIDEGNDERDARGQHPIYVGPDDRDAYMATKSLRRFSRAQSRRQSRASSRTGSPHDAVQRRVERSARRSIDSSARSPSHGHSNGPSPYRFPPKQQQQQQQQQQQEQKQKQQEQKQKPPQQQQEQQQKPPQQQQPPQQQGRSDSQINSQWEIDSQVHSHSYAPSQNRSDARSSLLNRSYAPNAAGPRAMTSAPQPQPQPQPRASSMRAAADPSAGRRSPTVARAEDLSAAPSGDPLRAIIAQLQRTIAELQDGHRALAARVAALEGRSGGAQPLASNGALSLTSAGAHSFAEKADRRRSPERGVYNYSRESHSDAPRQNGTRRSPSTGSAAELHRPSEQRSDLTEPPAEPSELPREKRPPVVALQASTRPRHNYHPHIDPSPARDANPPQRKGSIMR